MGYRKATLYDVPTLCELRKRQLVEEGHVEKALIDEELADFFAQKLEDGSLVEWFLEEDGQIVATAAIVFMPFPPNFDNMSGVRGYVTNMYTEPGHRGRGIATYMLGLLEDEARERGVSTLLLKASDMGRPVYEHFGFHEEHKYMEMDVV